jgi:hypothetical protein
LVDNEQRAVGQFQRLAVSVAIVLEEALRRCSPRVAAIGAVLKANKPSWLACNTETGTRSNLTMLDEPILPA